MAGKDFKQKILIRYCEEFQPADKETTTVQKTSEDILKDIRPMADVTTNEIAKYLTEHGYSIGFDDSTPVWLMKTERI